MEKKNIIQTYRAEGLCNVVLLEEVRVVAAHDQPVQVSGAHGGLKRKYGNILRIGHTT